MGAKNSADAEWRSRVDAFAVRAETNARRLNFLMAILGVATAALSVSEGMKVYKENNEHFCLYLEIVGAITICILLTISIRKPNKKP